MRPLHETLIRRVKQHLLERAALFFRHVGQLLDCLGLGFLRVGIAAVEADIDPKTG